MPRYIIKLEADGGPFYMEWSTVVDAPVTYGMRLSEFESYYREQYGEEGMQRLPQRMERVEAKGCSAQDWRESVDDCINFNRAGKDESWITKAEIIEWYCHRREPCELTGAVFDADTERHWRDGKVYLGFENESKVL